MKTLLCLATTVAAILGAAAEHAIAAEMRATRGSFSGTLEQCLAKGRRAIEDAGLRVLDNSRNAAWGEIEALQITVSVYCLADKDAYLVIGAGPHRAPAQSLDRLVDAVVDNMAR